MLSTKDNQLYTQENSIFQAAALTVLGDREDQQDSFGMEIRSNEGLLVVCDGMGGHKGGRAAGQLAVKCMIGKYAGDSYWNAPVQAMIELCKCADAQIQALQDDHGVSLNSGSTLVSVFIRDKFLMWCSVGDSRAYLLRNGEFVQLTKDQNYLTVLEERISAGLITEDEFKKEKERGEALISFLGIGHLRLIDYSLQPLELQEGDSVLLMSDGLYKVMPDCEIAKILDNFSNPADAVQALEMKAQKLAKHSHILRDNMTVELIKIK